MKRMFFLSALLVWCSLAVKAQTYQFKNDKLDTIKSFSNPGIYLKRSPSNFRLDSLAARANMLAALPNGAQPIPMPFAKPQNTDRMPVAKLGDTDNMHFTMMIKKLPPITGQKPVNP